MIVLPVNRGTTGGVPGATGGSPASAPTAPGAGISRDPDHPVGADRANLRTVADVWPANAVAIAGPGPARAFFRSTQGADPVKCPSRARRGVPILCAAWALAGCGGGANAPVYPPPAATAGAPGGDADATADADARGAATKETRAAVLDSVVKLIESAAFAPPPPPGSPSNFSLAAAQLNYYFEGAPAAEFAMDAPAREYLLPKIKEAGLRSLEDRKFTDRDARHIEDCLLYRSVAAHVAGEGDDLDRVRRLFDWVVRQVQLVPVGTLVPPDHPDYPQAQARPYDVLVRGLASEEAGDPTWAERSWVFLALCRQINVDAGLVVLRHGTDKPIRWACVALADGKPYLFDARIGLPIPGPGGRGVATLREAAADPEILAGLDLPGLSPYGVTHADLAGPVRVLIDSGTGYLSPRMRALQKRLASRNRMILHRDPAAQRDAFAQALGAKAEAVELWPIPLMVETRLFNDPAFNAATGYTLQLFDANKFAPLMRGRMAQLRGKIDGEAGAIRHYVSFRMEDELGVPDPRDRKKTIPIPAEIRRSLDLYATQFLALCHLDRGRPDQARFLFEQTLKLLGRPGRGVLDPPVRWGALSNLGHLAEGRGDDPAAIGYYAAADPTGQHHGDLLRARDLLWRDPMAPAVPSPTPAGPAAGEVAAGTPPAP